MKGADQADNNQMNRRYPTRPFVGVGGVIWRGDQFLMVRQERPHMRSVWTLPGGLQEVGETVKEALLREIREETLLDVEVSELIDVVDGIFKNDTDEVEFHYTLIDFTCNWVSGDAKPASDVDELKWMCFDDLDKIEIWEETKRIVVKSAQMQK